MVSHVAVFALGMFSMLVGTPAQRSPYLGSSDLGVLPMYLPKETDDRFGGGDVTTKEPPKKELHGGTLETEDVYNRVSEWPDAHKPFWYLNAIALQKQREQQQQQQMAQAQAQNQAQNQRPPFASRRRTNTQQN